MTICSEADQLEFNTRVIRSLSGRQARVALVVFQKAVNHNLNVFATLNDSNSFARDVPAPVRALIPYWRRRFVSEEMKFLDRFSK